MMLWKRPLSEPVVGWKCSLSCRSTDERSSAPQQRSPHQRRRQQQGRGCSTGSAAPPIGVVCGGAIRLRAATMRFIRPSLILASIGVREFTRMLPLGGAPHAEEIEDRVPLFDPEELGNKKNLFIHCRLW